MTTSSSSMLPYLDKHKGSLLPGSILTQSTADTATNASGVINENYETDDDLNTPATLVLHDTNSIMVHGMDVAEPVDD
eukprot:CAMPEP_0197052804 /NCGR_PEP_ID=MMETSP1384-20130603/27221_1 /TAXON_ID=29189 /ORGANISM="Ammonia sp." /LENGTH=77 /DNA_ID=CAMNT_0042485609 /DNA_START=1 /DNA_END=231 /DNA_ORIENTATION=+